MRRTNLVVASVASAVIVALSFLAATPGSTYKWSFLFLLPLIWLVYFLQDRLVLRPSHFALFALAILIHDLGTFGFYRKVFLGLRFDCYVHFMFGLVSGLIFFNAATERLPLSRRFLAFAVPIIILGIGGLHELFECFTTILLGPERGMLKLRPDEPYDTQKDLMNNLLGAIVAVLVSLPRRKPIPEPHRFAQHEEFSAPSA
jgi:uncharacterized membrane protein YjdF